jgi:hypothetical protein
MSDSENNDGQEPDGDFSLATQTQPDRNLPVVPSGKEGSLLSIRKELLKEHYGNGHSSIIAKMKEAGVVDTDTLMRTIIEEMCNDMDSLKGNELIHTQNGELREASVVASKHAETSEKVARVMQAQSRLEREAGIDLNSPQMRIIFQYFMKKSKEAFEDLKMHPDQQNLFFNCFVRRAENWKKDLKEEFKNISEEIGRNQNRNGY